MVQEPRGNFRRGELFCEDIAIDGTFDTYAQLAVFSETLGWEDRGTCFSERF